LHGESNADSWHDGRIMTGRQPDKNLIFIPQKA
jgi:hypothetical protein